ncbi:NAD-dependent epimerase/dehydratase family protein, partial [Pelagibacteraceae bacterium]|nr:NAD-dependent epimerase/dehydratase family protein [Pelagibacteraceae bacterium]
MKIKKKLLIIGGAGYIGSVLSPSLVQAGYQVTVLDNLIYNQKKFKISNKNFKFILGDLRNKKIINNLVKNNDIIILLAGLVGDPITKKYPLVSSKI